MSVSRKRSNLWLHFTQIGDAKAKCDICKSVFSYKGGTTSNLKKHMQSKHPTVSLDNNPEVSRIEMEPERSVVAQSALSSTAEPSTSGQGAVIRLTEEIPAASQAPKSKQQTKIISFATRPMSSTRRKKIDYKVLAMIIKDMQPFSIVNDEGFRDLIATLDKSYTLPSRTTLSRELLPRLYDDAVQKIKIMLEAVEFITLTTDSWTSLATESYMAITAHFIHDWKMQSCLLGCIKFGERHTIENIKTEILRVVDEWEIKAKVHSIVTDNASNIVGAARLTGWYHWPCTAHTLNLVVKDALNFETMTSIKKKIKSIVEYFHRSTVAAEKLRHIQEQMRANEHTLKLINDVETRWNSTFDMYERVIKFQEPVEAALGVLHAVPSLDMEEWDIIKNVCLILKPFKQITTELSAEKYVTISKIIVILQGIKSFLNQIKLEISNAVCKELIEKLLKNLNQRFPTPEYNVILTRPTFLDPRFKSNAFENVNALTQVRDNVTNSCASILPQRTVIESASETTKNDDTLWCVFDKKVEQITSTPVSAAIIQVRQYVEEPYLNRLEDPLTWWKSRELLYPALAKLAKRHLGVVATSVPSERVFSIAGEIISERRSRLSPKTAEKLIFLNANKDYITEFE